MDPLPGLPADLWDRMAAYLRGIDASLGRRPAAILVISGHWETAEPTVNTALRPPLLFDYSGFPEHTYRLTYPVAGSPLWLHACAACSRRRASRQPRIRIAASITASSCRSR